MTMNSPLSAGRARRLVVSITGFWALSATMAVVSWLVMVAIVVVASAMGFIFFATVSQVAAEGTGYRALDFWNVPWVSRAPARDKWTMMLNLLRPSWWVGVVAATDWAPSVVWLVLGASLLASVVSSLVLF